MTTIVDVQPGSARASGLERLAGPLLILGGIAFLIGGVSHPSDDGTGNKTEQLYDMLVKSAWYPSHGVMVAAMALFAAAIFALRKRSDMAPGVERTLKVVFVIASLATLSMVTHLFAALDAESLADGKPSLVSRLQTINETVFDTAWGLALVTLAVVGGLTRSVGNRITIPFGVVGGLAFALASATIAYIDTFDPLFQVASLLSVWAVLVGIIAIRDRR